MIVDSRTVNNQPEPMYIDLPVIAVNDGKARISSTIRMDGQDKVLWFEIDAAYRDYLSDDVLDAFVTASLLPAIVRGADIHPKGPMSSRLYYNLSNYALPLLSDYLGKPRVTKLIPAGLRSTYDKKGTGVLSGFSGGVDSFYHYYNHSGDRAPPEFRITHFCFNNVGSHGQETDDLDRKIFDWRYGRLRKFAIDEKKPFIQVDSNLDGFIGLHFEQTFAVRNVAVGQLLQNAMGKLLLASSNVYAETKIEPGMDMSKIEAVLLPMLGTERLDCILAGAQTTRTEKTARIADMPATYEYLDVCITPEDAPEGYMNCSVCGKCLRTQLTLDALGKLKEYGGVFVLERYRMLKNIYLIEIFSSRASLQRDVRNFIRRKKFPVPFTVRVIGFFFPYFMSAWISTYITPWLGRRKQLPTAVRRGALSA